MLTARSLRLAIALSLGFAVSFTGPVAFAKKSEPKAEVIEQLKSGRKNPKPKINERISKKLNKAFELAAEEKFDEAVALMDEILAVKKATPYERSKANQLKANFLYNQEKYDEAVAAARAAIAADGLNNVEHLQTKLMVSQILRANEKDAEAIKAWDEWAADAPKISGLDYVVQANNYYSLENYAEAVRLVDLALATGDKPEKNWYQFKANSLYQGEKYEEAAAYAKELMVKDPSDKQWLTLAVSAYLALEKYPDALELLNNAKAKNMLDTEALWTQLYQLYTYQEKYAEAGAAIEEGMAKGFLKSDAKHLSDLGQNYYTGAQDAKEDSPEAKAMLNKAVDAFKKALPMAGNDGTPELWLGQIALFEQDQPKVARDYLSSATKKTLKQPGNAFYLLGVAEDQVGNKAAARVALTEALKHKESMTNAQNYLKNLN